jgi:hypothetical protein
MRFSQPAFRVAILLIIVSVLAAFRILNAEAFQSPGTLVQLSTSHVPTADDVYFYRSVYPGMVRRGIISMTGSDPGPLLATLY